MKRIGIRELKAHLGTYLACLSEGEPLVVTRRGKPVARLEAIPPIRPDLPEGLRELVEAGRLIDRGPMRDLPTPLRMTRGEETSTDFVREQRR